MNELELPLRPVGHRNRLGAARASTRVAVTIDAIRPPAGAVHVQLDRLAPLLRSRGVSPIVVGRKMPREMPVSDGDAYETVVRLPGLRREPASSLSFTALVAARIVRDLPDVIHARGLRAAAAAAMFGAQLIRRPYVVSVLDSGPDGDVARLRRTFRGRRRLEQFARTATAFVCVSGDTERDLLAHGVDRRQIVRVPQGVDIGHFRPRRLDDEAVVRLRRALGLPGAGPLTVTAGGPVASARVDQLIAAHATVPGTLLVLGHGCALARLRPLASAAGVADRVIFRPDVADVAPFFECSDVFVSCPDRDGAGEVAALQAMASGLPVVASEGDLGPLVDQTTGVLVEDLTPGVLGPATAVLLADRDRRAELGRAGRQRVVADHTLTRTADELTALYQRIRP